jgi:hypothetical protein
MAKQLPTAGGSGGGRTSGGITGSGGGNVTPIYKQSIPPSTVKVVPPMSDVARGLTNKNTTNVTNARKSGLVTSQLSSGVNVNSKPKTTIKINSNK